MRKVTVLAALLCVLGSAGNACAWGDLGHKVICEIAFNNMKPATKAAVVKLISADKKSPFPSFSEACVWPDHPRRRAPEHFVNLARDATSLTNTCGVAAECVVNAIAKDLAVLSSKTAAVEEKSESMKFLGHWVGDVHQPLHVSFEDDRGGNSIKVSGECGSNMHSTWDTCLVEAAVGKDFHDAAEKLGKSITGAQRQEWVKSNPKEWANESFKITESVQTKYCVKNGNSCDKPSGGVRIDQAYIDANVPIVKTQLQKAGIRLAHMLDQALEN